MNHLIDETLIWANARNLLGKDELSIRTQYIKCVEEVGELGAGLIRNDGRAIKDALGDTLVTLIILANKCGYDLDACLSHALAEIKDRKGKTVNGAFIKEGE
jgi:NTP pyrophosphatase (non-canonical NTP hydrolase)